MNKLLKIGLIVTGSIIGLFLLANIGFNLWLKYQLPDYIKNKTPYQISYKSLKVDIFSGQISAEKIHIDNKNSEDEGLKINGTIENLLVNRLGFLGFLFQNKVEPDNISFGSPNLKIVLSNQTTKTKTGKLLPEFKIKNFNISKGNIEVFKNSNQKMFSCRDLDFNIDHLNFTEKEEETFLPFTFDSYDIIGRDFYFQPNSVYRLTAKSILTKDSQILIEQPEVKSLLSFSDFLKAFPKTNSMFGLTAKQMVFKMVLFNKKALSWEEGKFVKANIIVQNRNNKAKSTAGGESNLSIDLQDVIVERSNVKILNEEGSVAMSMDDVFLNLKNLTLNSETIKEKIPFTYKDFNFKSKGLFFDLGKHYRLMTGKASADLHSIDVQSIELKPKMTRAQFVKSIPMENDLFDVSVSRLQLLGLDWKFENNQPNVKLQNAVFNQLDASIFRSKIPADNPKEKLLYSKLLRSIKFPLFINDLKVKNSRLVYEEDKPDSNGPGKISFSNFNMNVRNVNSNKLKGKPTEVPITINCLFMDTSPMKLNWKFNTADTTDRFTISGNISDLPASRITPFTKPYLNLVATGSINQLDFNFRGNNEGLNGRLKVVHENLRVTILNKETKKKNKFLSAVANVIVKTDSKPYPESVEVKVSRNKEKSFFNLFWRGIEDGLKKTLVRL